MPKGQSHYDIANHLMLELDPRNPRVRLSVITLLVEKMDLEPAEVLPLAQELLGWAGAELQSAVGDYLARSEQNAELEEEEEPENPWDQGRGYI